jgi:hypothetical protein
MVWVIFLDFFLLLYVYTYVCVYIYIYIYIIGQHGRLLSKENLQKNIRTYADQGVVKN